jgi:hypothetical protein
MSIVPANQHIPIISPAFYRRVVLNTKFPSTTFVEYATQYDIAFYSKHNYSYFKLSSNANFDNLWDDLYIVGYQVHTVDGYKWLPVFNYKYVINKIVFNEEFYKTYEIYIKRFKDKKINKLFHNTITDLVLKNKYASKFNHHIAGYVADFWC